MSENGLKEKQNANNQMLVHILHINIVFYFIFNRQTKHCFIVFKAVHPIVLDRQLAVLGNVKEVL